MKSKQIETIAIECPSNECRGEKRLYRFIGYEGVAWNRMAVYECELCERKINRNHNYSHE